MLLAPTESSEMRAPLLEAGASLRVMRSGVSVYREQIGDIEVIGKTGDGHRGTR